MTDNAQVIDIAILAHNEAETLPGLIDDLARQTLPGEAEGLCIQLLSNGSRDGTAEVARTRLARHPHLARCVTIHDFAEGGKSRTMDFFLSDLMRPDADLVFFVDGDIRLPRTGTLAEMVDAMTKRHELAAFVSRPVKDIVHDDLEVGTFARLISAGGGTLYDWRKTISGQLFALRGDFARRLRLPHGLPVEDGFIRAMVVTDFLSRPEDLSRIDGDEAVFHVYESIRGPVELLRHQVRLVTGGAINSALFRLIRRDCADRDQTSALLARAADTPGWLVGTLKRELPVAPYGWVPFAFLTERLPERWRGTGVKRTLVLVIGFALDAVAWVMASLRLALGRGAGHW